MAFGMNTAAAGSAAVYKIEIIVAGPDGHTKLEVEARDEAHRDEMVGRVREVLDADPGVTERDVKPDNASGSPSTSGWWFGTLRSWPSAGEVPIQVERVGLELRAYDRVAGHLRSLWDYAWGGRCVTANAVTADITALADDLDTKTVGLSTADVIARLRALALAISW